MDISAACVCVLVLPVTARCSQAKVEHWHSGKSMTQPLLHPTGLVWRRRHRTNTDHRPSSRHWRTSPRDAGSRWCGMSSCVNENWTRSVSAPVHNTRHFWKKKKKKRCTLTICETAIHTFSTVMKTSQLEPMAVKQRWFVSPAGCTHVQIHKQFLSLWTHPACLWAGEMIRGQILNYSCLGEQKLQCWCIRRLRARAMRAPRLMLTDELGVALRAAQGEEAPLLICPPTRFFLFLFPGSK